MEASEAYHNAPGNQQYHSNQLISTSKPTLTECQSLNLLKMVSSSTYNYCDLSKFSVKFFQFKFSQKNIYINRAATFITKVLVRKA